MRRPTRFMYPSNTYTYIAYIYKPNHSSCLSFAPPFLRQNFIRDNKTLTKHDNLFPRLYRNQSQQNNWLHATYNYTNGEIFIVWLEKRLKLSKWARVVYTEVYSPGIFSFTSHPSIQSIRIRCSGFDGIAQRCSGHCKWLKIILSIDLFLIKTKFWIVCWAIIEMVGGF